MAAKAMAESRAVGQQANGIEMRRQRHAAVVRPTAKGDLQTEKSVQGRGHSDGSACVGANGQGTEPRRRRNGSTGTRTAGQALLIEIPRIPRCPQALRHTRDTQGELNHLGLPKDDAAGTLQRLHKGVFPDDIAQIDLRAGAPHAPPPAGLTEMGSPSGPRSTPARADGPSLDFVLSAFRGHMLVGAKLRPGPDPARYNVATEVISPRRN